MKRRVQNRGLKARARGSNSDLFGPRPLANVRFLGSGAWLAQTDDPQFEIILPRRQMRSGKYELVVSIDHTAGTRLNPRVYFDLGHGFDEAGSVQLPNISKTTTFVVKVPAGTIRLRFDPIAIKGPFSLQSLTARPLNLSQAIEDASNAASGKRIAAFIAAVSSQARLVGPHDESSERLSSAANYQSWIRDHEALAPDLPARVRKHLGAFSQLPRISVVMPTYNANVAWLRAAVESVRSQLYSDWELCIADDCSTHDEIADALSQIEKLDPRIKVTRLAANGGISAATNAAIAEATGDWIAFLDHDDTLSVDALALLAVAAMTNPQANIIYTDEDKIDEHGARYDPYMKGCWNRELFYAQNYLNHLTSIRREIVAAAGPLRSDFDGSQDYDLLLRCIENVEEDAIVHVPFVCYHWRFSQHRSNFSLTHADRSYRAAVRALNEHFARTGSPAIAVQVAEDTYYSRAKWTPPDEPLVSLIIPTRDRRSILEAAIESIVRKTSYPNYEIIVADNDSSERETLDYLENLTRTGTARVVKTPGPFNYSKINNLAVAEAKGEILGFINNDVEVRNDAWLTELVSHLARPDVGATGAKLYYPDGRIQHAGVVTGIGGVAGHIYRLASERDPGPFSSLKLPREITCVTAACMLVRASLFRDLGGFDEQNLAVAFNDVDLCLRIREAGMKIIWTPFAELTHFESVSRGLDTDPDKRLRFQSEVNYMLARWGDTLANDPYYSPNLTLEHEDGSLASLPRVRRPWN